ncbi:MAG: glycerol-3-phosphate 1-O-acyltransferase PlsY, partial [Nitrospiraceae bacterium]
ENPGTGGEGMNVGEWLPALLATGGYLLGSVPFGVLVAKALGTVDPREAGSRNIGFTNVLRVAGKKAGFLTLAGDMGKGWVVAWLATRMLESDVWVLVVALSPVVGHLYPVFLKFRGGKGVATAMGAVTGVAPVLGLALVLIWVVTAALWRYSSGAAVAAFIGLPIVGAMVGVSWKTVAFLLAVSGLVLWRHGENIVRLWNGTERKIGAGVSNI